MRRFIDRAIRTCLLGGAAVLTLAGLLGFSGARINTTPSIPVGLYWTSSQALARGAYVQLCPLPGPIFERAKKRRMIVTGFCPGEYGFLMKRIQGLGQDRITLSDAGVTVNGQLLPNSSIPNENANVWPRYHLTQLRLKSDEVLVMGEHHLHSFDSRYFGPLRLSQIRSVIVPVLTW